MILYADDNFEFGQLLQEIAEKAGHKCMLAPNGLKAVELCKGRDNYFPLIFLDIRMPVMDGFEAARQIRAQGYPNGLARIYALTGDLTEAVRMECLESGFDGFLAKPFDFMQVIEFMDKFDYEDMVKNEPAT